MKKEEVIKVLDAQDVLIKEQNRFRRDALIFIFEKGMWEEFIKYHCEKAVERL